MFDILYIIYPAWHVRSGLQCGSSTHGTLRVSSPRAGRQLTLSARSGSSWRASVYTLVRFLVTQGSGTVALQHIVMTRIRVILYPRYNWKD